MKCVCSWFIPYITYTVTYAITSIYAITKIVWVFIVAVMSSRHPQLSRGHTAVISIYLNQNCCISLGVAWKWWWWLRICIRHTRVLYTSRGDSTRSIWAHTCCIETQINTFCKNNFDAGWKITKRMCSPLCSAAQHICESKINNKSENKNAIVDFSLVFFVFNKLQCKIEEYLHFYIYYMFLVARL